MKKLLSCMVTLIFLVSFATVNYAGETINIIGKVVAYDAGKSITVREDDNKDYLLTISGDVIDGKDKAIVIGDTVDIEATDGVATYILVDTDIYMDEDDDEAVLEDERLYEDQ